jgi:hypothetical protein
MNYKTANTLTEELFAALTRLHSTDNKEIVEVEFISTGDFGVNFDRSPSWQIWREI